MSDFQLAQVNIAKILAPMDDLIMKDFVDNLEAVYKISDSHKGFVLRINNEDHPTELRDAFPDDTFIVNISVWKNIDALFDFTYKSGHVEILKRKKEWFSKIEMKYMACWYVLKGHIPTHKEAKQRLDHINNHGSSPYAFSFKDKFSITDFLNHKVLT